MDWLESTRAAFLRAINREENLSRYAERVGVSYSIVNRLRSGKTSFAKLDLSTFFRLFPELKIFFFREDYPERHNRRDAVEVGGDLSGIVVQNGRIGDFHPCGGGESVDLRTLARKVRRSDRFSPEERLKILDFLDEEL